MKKAQTYCRPECGHAARRGVTTGRAPVARHGYRPEDASIVSRAAVVAAVTRRRSSRFTLEDIREDLGVTHAAQLDAIDKELLTLCAMHAVVHVGMDDEGRAVYVAKREESK